MDFIWIYIKGPSYFGKTGIFNELDYSIKSVRKNFIGESRCFVVGDDPGLDVEHIPCKAIESSKFGYYRHFDMLNKVKTALKVTKSEDFVLMYDDIYLLKPVSALDLQKVYAKQRIDDLNEYLSIRKGDPSYIRCWENTYNRILEFRDDIYDWETHLPRYYDVDKFNYIVDRYSIDRVAYLVYSLYAGTFAGSTEILTDDIQSNVVLDRPLHNNYEKDFSATYLNVYDEGITQEFRKRMIDLFD